MDYKYKFSVVIPVYNVEGYLAETLDSVIGQSIGFENNIQIILVNDGSPDDSEKICLEYAKKYPDNILYLKQENKGVSAARNYGMQYVEGKYVNFLDSDDKWTSGSFQAVYDFLKNVGTRLTWWPVHRNFLRQGTIITGFSLNMSRGAGLSMYWKNIIMCRCM